VTVIDRGAVLTATATAALSALLVGVINIGVDEVKALLAERREKRKGKAS
jgi:hypothetical protein